MSDEPLTKKEWESFLCNHWVHLKTEMADLKADTNWLKWLNALIIAGLIGWAVKDLLGV